MIISNKKEFIILSPPKTGTRFRIQYYNAFNYFLGLHLELKHLKRISNFDQNVNYDLIASRYKKYVYVRNPWERAASLHNMSLKHKNNLSEIDKKNDFIKWIKSDKYIRQALPTKNFMVDENGSYIIDKILRVEEWDENLNFINQQLNFKTENDTQYTSNYNYNETYKKWYNDETIQIVKDKESYLINLSPYTFV